MRNSPRSLPACLSRFAILMVSLVAIGCGEERLYDDQYGFLDLTPFFFDGSSVGDPTRALNQIKDVVPHKGWLNGERAEYYDFGLVGRVNKRTSSSTPDYAVVHPMYFLFDDARNPLFSRPIYEPRTGLWHLRGGKALKDPNPIPNAKRDVVYPNRQRDLVFDRRRQSNDFQRPIIDRLLNDGNYAGIWEIIEVIAPAGYEPDSIKSYETLKKGLEAGDFVEKSTRKVINCPVIDDRMYIQPTAMYYGIPRPRIEVWYKTKLGGCFLADGWQTLGEMSEEFLPFMASSKTADHARRLDTFDVIRFSIGEGTAARASVVAPIGKMYQPRVTVANQNPLLTALEVRYNDNFLTDAEPRTSEDSPPGYRPVRWMHDITVAQDPPFEFGTFRRVDAIDPAQVTARSGPFTRNFPLIGKAVSCRGAQGPKNCEGLFAAPGVPLVCNQTPNADLAVAELPPGKTLVDVIELKEGGPRCDLPEVRYAEFCSPGIARCSLNKERAANFDFVSHSEKAIRIPQAAASSPLIGGYACAPATGGSCMMRCDSAASTTGAPTSEEVEISYIGPDLKMKTEKGSLAFDVRCGNLPGYKCVTPHDGNFRPAVPNRLKVCMRSCSTSKADKFNEKWCALPLTAKINEWVDDADISQGQTCGNLGLGESVCHWSPSFEPRDPRTNFVP